MIKFEKLDFDSNKVFFSSDFHYSHKNISQESAWDKENQDKAIRPWNVPEMNDYIINEINSKVPYDGLLIHLGDWSFGGIDKAVELRSNIVCENIIGCYGNHDHNILNRPDLQSMFTMIDHILYIKIEHQDIVCCHYPIMSWPSMGKTRSWMLHGHCHGSLQDNPNSKILDVGFDTCLYGHQQYTLYSFKELQEIMEQKAFKPVDHHG